MQFCHCDKTCDVRGKDGSMKKPKWVFEKELEALLEAAQNATNDDTARKYLKEAENKIYGYDDISMELQKEYKRWIEEAENERF